MCVVFESPKGQNYMNTVQFNKRSANYLLNMLLLVIPTVSYDEPSDP